MRNDQIEATWTYHRLTSHARAEVRPSGSSPDWANHPRPYKLYPRLEPIPLPPARAISCLPALNAIASPGLDRSEPSAPDLGALAAILHYSAGIVRRLTLPKTGKALEFRAAPCTGALYHVDVYLVAGPLDGLDTGVYQFGPHDHALRRLRSGDWRAALVEACGDQPWVAQAPVSLVLTTTFWRNGWRYGDRAYRHAFWDGGTILANVLAVATSYGLPAGVVTGFVDRTVNRLLDLDAQREVALAVVPLGGASETAQPSPGPVEPLRLRTAVYSAAEADFPSIRAIHAAASLSRSDEVRAWRETPHPPASSPVRGSGGDEAHVLLLSRARERGPGGEGFLNVEACIASRGSARRFRRTWIGAETLGTVLWAATRGFPADYRASRHDSPVERLLIVSAVDGLDPGLYRYWPGRGTVELIGVPANPRDLAGRLVLDEQRGADAAVTVFLMADLMAILGRLGNRGYRAAQMEAGIVAGKLYLAASEAGLGVTGLTFYDDDVSRAFGTDAASLSPMLAVALGQPG